MEISHETVPSRESPEEVVVTMTPVTGPRQAKRVTKVTRGELRQTVSVQASLDQFLTSAAPKTPGFDKSSGDASEFFPFVTTSVAISR